MITAVTRQSWRRAQRGMIYHLTTEEQVTIGERIYWAVGAAVCGKDPEFWLAGLDTKPTAHPTCAVCERISIYANAATTKD